VSLYRFIKVSKRNRKKGIEHLVGYCPVPWCDKEPSEEFVYLMSWKGTADYEPFNVYTCPKCECAFDGVAIKEYSKSKHYEK